MDEATKEVLTLYAPIISAIISAIVLWLQSRQKKTIETVASDVLRVEKATNSMKDQLIAATRTAAHAEGMDQQRTDQALRDGERARGAAEAGLASPPAAPSETEAKVIVVPPTSNAP
jgi:hypothetical protein